MKAILRVPTKVQYGYIEAEVEGTIEEIVEEYNHLSKEVLKEEKNGEGLTDKEFNSVLDGYVWRNESLRVEDYEGMSQTQQAIIQLIKRSRKRALYKAHHEQRRNQTEGEVLHDYWGNL